MNRLVTPWCIKCVSVVD